MTKIKIVRRNKIKNRLWYNYFDYLYYCYHSLFFGTLIFCGNKLTAVNNFLLLKQRLKLTEAFEPSICFIVAMFYTAPTVFMIPARLGKFVHKIPFPISLRKKIIFSVKWSVKLLRDSKGSFRINECADHLLSSIYGEGLVFDKKRELYSESLMNRHLVRRFYK